MTTESRRTETVLPTPPARFINRELSWLAFNERVMEEAVDLSHPLLERVRFLSISGGNLDEFYMVRVAGLQAQVEEGINSRSQDGLTAKEQLEAIRARVARLMDEQQVLWRSLLDELRQERIQVLEIADLTPDDLTWLQARFMSAFFPIMTPIAVDPAHPFPFIPNATLSLALQLESSEDAERLDAVVLLPPSTPRFIRLPGDAVRFVRIEHVTLAFVDMLFPGFRVLASGVFRVIRDSEIEIDEEAEDLVRSYETVDVAQHDETRHFGIIRNQGTTGITLGTSAVTLDVKVKLIDIKNMTPAAVSLMPGAYGQILTSEELADLTAFLHSMK